MPQPMQTWRRTSFFHWLAIAVLLWGFLLPSVSQALGLNHTALGAVTDEVCSATGTHAADGDASHQSGDSHCPLCTLHHVSGGPASAPLLRFELGQPSHWVPPLYLQARAARFAWVLQPAQAPPLPFALI